MVNLSVGHVPKDVLYGELVTGTRAIGQPYLRYKDTCKCEIKMAGIEMNNLETAASEADIHSWL